MMVAAPLGAAPILRAEGTAESYPQARYVLNIVRFLC